VDADDPHHLSCRRLLEDHRGPLLVPTLVISEVSFLIERNVGTRAELTVLRDLAEGRLEPIPVTAEDWPRIIELVWSYRDLPLGTVDASVVALAERLKIKQIATLDHRHFSVVRPAHVEAFELLP
jgi:predicted nucleic acid-binding protein